MKSAALSKASHPDAHPKHLATGTELAVAELKALLKHARHLKAERQAKVLRQTMRGKSLALLLEKPSLRTRFSFAVAIQELGGFVVELTAAQRKAESPEDTARVLGGYCHWIAIRTFDQDVITRMARVSPVPVINALSDTHHPCQVLADAMALEETYGSLHGLTVAYVGDGNNMLHSLLLLLPYLGVHLRYSCPEGFQPDPAIVALARQRAAGSRGKVERFATPAGAVHGADGIYTDVWTSMGAESSAALREAAFTGYQVNEELYSRAAPNAVVMHCMPMVRGGEITDAMADHPRALLFLQSENRLHVQKALLETLAP